MQPVSCTNTHYDVTDLLNHGIVKNTKTWISLERNITVLQNKKILNLCLRWHVLISYHFLAEVTFNKLAGLRLATLSKKRIWHRWIFPVNFVKFLRTSFLQNTSGRLLLHGVSSKFFWKVCKPFFSNKATNFDDKIILLEKGEAVSKKEEVVTRFNNSLTT